MCLAIPMQVVDVDGFNARCEAKGIEREVSLFMMQDEPVEPGDFVMVHVGYAIQKVSQQDAQSAWELFDQVLEAMDQ
ncbi:MAG: HypC/HybG/HupF family hydrogenase formation chaperone [Gammaproteobacteria bacterium]|jgi:hydrogenase expression/formation protein HypC|nr:MAG: hydrogenase assembly protein HypC [Gammaproteobacteria bacterium SG8_31]